MRLKTNKAVNLIRYICEKVPDLTYEKLWAMLFKIDMTHYIETGKSMTGFRYVKHECGPIPEPKQFAKAMKLS